MTQAEIRAMLDRVDARRLRQEAGIRQVTVAEALGTRQAAISALEHGRRSARGRTGLRWARVVAGLERHAAVAAALGAGEPGEAA